MLRRKPAAASTPAAAPQPACSCGRPPVAAPVPTLRQQPSTVRRRGAGYRQDAQPVQAPPDPAASASARGPETGDPEMEGTARREMVTAPLPPPEEGRVENPLFRFVFVPPLTQQPAVPKTSIKEQFPQSLGLKRRRVVYRASRDHFPPPLSPGRGGLPKSTPPAHLWNRVRAVALKPPLQVVTRKPGSCVSSHTRRNQVSVTLRPRPGYVPKVPTTPFRDQVVNLQALPPEEADPALALLCPVRALRQYTDRTQSFRTSEQLFVCYGGQQKGKAVSKQRMAHWIVDAITLAYEAQGVPCPLRLRAHSTRGVASSWALARGTSLADICRAAGWATPNTFARFYSLRVEPVSSCVLTSNG